jgi:hypothetical protein
LLNQLPLGCLEKRRKLPDEVAEGGKIDLLLAIAQGFSGVRMDLD